MQKESKGNFHGKKQTIITYFWQYTLASAYTLTVQASKHRLNIFYEQWMLINNIQWTWRQTEIKKNKNYYADRWTEAEHFAIICSWTGERKSAAEYTWASFSLFIPPHCLFCLLGLLILQLKISEIMSHYLIFWQFSNNVSQENQQSKVIEINFL